MAQPTKKKKIKKSFAQANHVGGSDRDKIWIPHLNFLQSPDGTFIQNDDVSSLTILRGGPIIILFTQNII